MNPVTIIPIPGLPLVEPGDDLASLILAAMAQAGLAFVSGDILVVAQKIVSKAEGRYRLLDDITPSPRASALAAEIDKYARHVELVISESTDAVRQREHLLIVSHRLG